jgi:hypothetical protein
MTDLRKAAEMALEALEEIGDEWGFTSERTVPNRTKAIQALRQALAQPVDAINMTQERVDETAKYEHEPWPSVQCVCGGTIYFKYTPPISDYHEGWEEGFKAAKHKWVGLTDEEIYDYADKFLYDGGSNYGVLSFGKAVEAKLKEKNSG